MPRSIRPHPVRPLHRNGTVCTHRTRPTGRPENPAECTGRIGYATSCPCGWSAADALRTVVDEQRRYHHQHWTATPEQGPAAEVAVGWSLLGPDALWRRVRTVVTAEAATTITFDDHVTARFEISAGPVTVIPAGAPGRN